MKPTPYTFQPFETVAGSTSFYDPAGIVADLLATLKVLGVDVEDDDLTDPTCLTELQEEAIEDLTRELEDAAELPPFCSLNWQDGELLVTPYVDLQDGDWHRISEDDFDAWYAHSSGEYQYHINERGNATLYAVTRSEIWGIV
jgi:hypothetical protein